MGIGISVFLMALGAVLLWAVTTTVAGVSINTIGIILIVVGLIGLVAGMLATQRTTTTRTERPVA